MERARRAEEHQDAIDESHVADMAQGEGEQQQAADQHHRLTHRQDGPPVHAVRHLAAHQTQRQERQELRQPRVSERERAARELVDLPANGHRLNLDGQHRAQARQQIEAEVSMLEDGEPGSRSLMSHAGGAVIHGPVARHRLTVSAPKAAGAWVRQGRRDTFLSR